MAKAGFYAVKSGRKVGVFLDWDTCEKSVKGFKGAKYKKFNTFNEALEYIDCNDIGIENKSKEEIEDTLDALSYEMPCFYVDGSYNSDLNRYGYGIAVVRNGELKFKGFGGDDDEVLADYRNIVGELKASIKAVQIARQQGMKNIAIVYDYKGVECWATKEWKCKNTLTKMYADYMERYMEDVKIKFVKVQAHTGIVGNNMADRLAKKGSKIKE